MGHFCTSRQFFFVFFFFYKVFHMIKRFLTGKEHKKPILIDAIICNRYINFHIHVCSVYNYVSFADIVFFGECLPMKFADNINVSS